MKYTPTECNVTVKDHKNTAPGREEYRLINAAKTDIGRCSKEILQKLTEEVNNITKLQQWKSTKEVIDWFKCIHNKESVRFITFDIVAFYPSISPQLLERAIKFARQKVFINNFDINIINHARKTFLYHKGVPWTKKGNVNGLPWGPSMVQNVVS